MAVSFLSLIYVSLVTYLLSNTKMACRVIRVEGGFYLSVWHHGYMWWQVLQTDRTRKDDIGSTCGGLL